MARDYRADEAVGVVEGVMEARNMDDCYEDRNLLAQLCLVLARDRGWQVGVDQDDPELIHIQLPTGQISYHLKDSCLTDLPVQAWDKHTTEEKRTRIRKLLAIKKLYEPTWWANAQNGMITVEK